jgi:hypothetical protein
MTPDDLKEASKFLWAVLLLPVGMVWKKVNGAVQKEDFKDYSNEVKEVIKAHAEQDEKKFDQQRETMLAIFKKLDEMAQDQGDLKATAARVEATLTFIRPPRP